MSRPGKKKKNKKLKKGAIIALIVAAGGMLAAMVFVLGFHTKEVRFHGNTRMTTAELNDYVFAEGLPANSLIYKLFGAKDRSLPFASEYEVSLRTPEIIDIYVNEKPLVGYVRGEEEVYYIDDKGCVAEISDMALGDYPEIRGIEAGKLEKGDHLPVPDEALNAIVGYADTLARYDIDAQAIDFDEEYMASVTIKDVKIYCGENEYVTEKMERIKNITPRLDDLSGVIHMEKFDGTSKNLYIQT